MLCRQRLAFLRRPKTEPANGIYTNNILHQQGINLGDTITLTPHWLLRGAVSQDWFWTNNYSLSKPLYDDYCSVVIGNPNTPNIESQGVSWTTSIMFKPRENMTIYGTFADSLQAPDTVVVSSPPNFVINSGQALAPYRDIEGEVGYKLVSRRINFETARSASSGHILEIPWHSLSAPVLPSGRVYYLRD